MARRRRSRRNVTERDPVWEPPMELRERIQAHAMRWSRDIRDIQEDLEQEALLSIWMKGETKAPLDHQLRTARNRMLSVRKLGKSVDGKLDATYKRSRPYTVLSMQHDGIRLDDGVLPFEDLLPSRDRVEETVIAKLMFLDLISLLEPRERLCAVLLYMGFTPREVADEARYSLDLVGHLLDCARRKLCSYLQDCEES